MHSSLSMTFMNDRRVEHFYCGYIILGEYADPILWPKPTPNAAGMREGFSQLERGALCRFLPLTTSGEMALKEGGNQTLWSATFYSGAFHIGERDRNKGGARYMSTKAFVVKHMEYRHSMQFFKALATMDEWSDLL